MHKKDLAMRPILSATDTYKYNLAKWLDDKLMPLSANDLTAAWLAQLVRRQSAGRPDHHSGSYRNSSGILGI